MTGPIDMRNLSGLMAGGEETNEGKVGAEASAAGEAKRAANGAVGDDPAAGDARKVADLQLESVSRRVEAIESELRALRAQLSSLVARAS